MGQTNNTIVCVSSDHGEMLGDHEEFGKTVPWQGSVSVPLVCVGRPQGILVGQVIDIPVSTMDMAGTFIDYAESQVHIAHCHVLRAQMQTTDATLCVLQPAKGMTTQSLRCLLDGTCVTHPEGQYRDYVSSGLGVWREVVQQINSSITYKFICCRGSCPGRPNVNSDDPATVQAQQSQPFAYDDNAFEREVSIRWPCCDYQLPL